MSIEQAMASMAAKVSPQDYYKEVNDELQQEDLAES
jgi:hypothetical protein